MTQLEELVCAEAEALKIHAHEGEIQNLVADAIEPNDITMCVYGQMTGNCMNERAQELIKNCCERVFNAGVIPPERIKETELNGSPRGMERLRYWSPIEVWLYQSEKREISKLISFLKGETKKLF